MIKKCQVTIEVNIDSPEAVARTIFFLYNHVAEPEARKVIQEMLSEETLASARYMLGEYPDYKDMYDWLKGIEL